MQEMFRLSMSHLLVPRGISDESHSLGYHRRRRDRIRSCVDQISSEQTDAPKTTGEIVVGQLLAMTLMKFIGGERYANPDRRCRESHEINK